MSTSPPVVGSFLASALHRFEHILGDNWDPPSETVLSTWVYGSIYALGVLYVVFVFQMPEYLRHKDRAFARRWLRDQKRQGNADAKLEDAPSWDKREPAWVRSALFFWNLLLGVFSMFGFYFVAKATLAEVRRTSLPDDLCNSIAEYANPWTAIFCFSKIPELLDTVFLICRRRSPALLHWYHHITTMIFCTEAVHHRLNNGSWFAVMNLLVHSIMYTYYAFATYVRFPNWLRALITSLQISQMFFGTFFVMYNMWFCNSHPTLNLFGLLMYISYAALFIQLFVNYYIRAPQRRTPAQPRKAD